MFLALALAALAASQAPDEEARLRERAARCGSELTWAADWDAAAARARDEHKLVLVSFQNYPGFELGELASIGPFMDPDIVALVEARLVPLRLKLGMEAPFTSPEVYGMGPSTFGVALMLASPEGELLAETFSLESAVVYEFLRAGLAALGGPFELARADIGSSVLNAKDARADAQRLLVGGELERAQFRLENLTKIGAERLPHLRADLARLRGDPRGGLAALEELPGDDPERLEREAGFLTSLGEYAEAAARLASIVTPSASARFQRAMLALARAERAAGLAELRTLALEDPETRWSWLAAALLVNPALTTRDTWSLVPPARELLAEGLAVPRAPLEVGDEARAAAEAAAWLLARQRADGSWPGPSDLSRGPADEPSPLALGTTALCGLALHGAARGGTGADESAAAARRALTHLAEVAERQRRARPAEVLMDYTVWSHPCTLLLAATVAGASTSEPVRALARDALAELARKQQKDGGWSYYLSGTVAGSATPYQVSMSFTTALALRALVAAPVLDVDLEEELLSGAADALEGMRRDDGAFVYLAEHTSVARTGGTPGDAAGRGPGCALALLEAGRADVEDVRERLELFLAHLPALEHEQGKVLMHCGPEAQGSHYVLFDYWQAAEAVAALPATERAPFRTRLTRAILAAHNADGSFVDNPMIGRAAGTAMALLALQALARE
jgi:hypothetical protein